MSHLVYAIAIQQFSEGTFDDGWAVADTGV